MKELSAELESVGLSSVKTYIQSGNIVFRESKKTKSALAAQIKKTIKNKFGFEVSVIVVSQKELAGAIKNSPFAKIPSEEANKVLHLFFMDEVPSNIRRDRLESLQQVGEEWKLKGSVFYLYTPNGFGKSKLATQVEKILGVPATARNWRTVCTLLELASADQ